MSAGKGVFLFIMGAAAGSTVAALLMKRHMEKKYQRIQKERDDLEEYVKFLRDKDIAGDMASNLEYVSDGKIGEGEEERTVSGKTISSKSPSNKGSGGPAITDYTQYYKKKAEEQLKEERNQNSAGIGKEVNAVKEMYDLYPREYDVGDDPRDAEDAEDADEEVTPDYDERSEERQSGMRPEEIDPGEYDALPHYDSVTLCYYTQDDILATAEGEVIDDVAELVGRTMYDQNKGHDAFVSDPDADLIYVRNYSRQTDYEIEKVEGSYTDYYPDGTGTFRNY